jgi:hypothetical protein
MLLIRELVTSEPTMPKAAPLISVRVKHWHDIIGDSTLADAILDRLVHNAHRLTLKGENNVDTRARLGRRPGSSESPAGFDQNWRPLRSESPADFVGMREQMRGAITA